MLRSLVLVLVPPVRVDSSSHSDTNACCRPSCWAPLSQQGCPAVIGPSPSGPEFLHIQCQGPVRSKPAAPAPKRAGKQAAQSISASSSNSQPVPELPIEHVQELSSGLFGLAKRSFTQCRGKRHSDTSNIHVSMGLTLPVLCMLCCGYKVLQFCGATFFGGGGASHHDHPIPPRGGGRHNNWGGGFNGGRG